MGFHVIVTCQGTGKLDLNYAVKIFFLHIFLVWAVQHKDTRRKYSEEKIQFFCMIKLLFLPANRL